ncbi:lysozyme-like domain-containing protein [Chytridium lagenaria]|nr:lysozyme-like domain-containing protein [Chytridium lagenaria]
MITSTTIRRALFIGALLSATLHVIHSSPINILRQDPTTTCTNEGEYTCGTNTLSQSTVLQCIKGVHVLISTCASSCKTINNSPFCVPAEHPVTPDPISPQLIGVSADFAPKGTITAKGSPLFSVDPATVKMGDNDITCNDAGYSCGPLSAEGYGTIVQCIHGMFVMISSCSTSTQHACQVINNSPFCVEGEGKSGIYMTVKKETPPSSSVGNDLKSTSTSRVDVKTSTIPLPTSQNPSPPSTSPQAPAPAPAPTPAPAPAPVPAPPQPAPPQNSPPTGPAPFTQLGLTQCQYDIILKITSVFETSSQSHRYDLCANLNDGQGISAGFTQFTTSSGSLLRVIQTYLTLTTLPSTPLAAYVPSLIASRGNNGHVTGPGSVVGLTDFCEKWQSTSLSDPVAFQTAQEIVQQEMYLLPTKPLIDALGIKTALGIGLLYDASIQLGHSGAEAIAQGAGIPPSQSRDEREFISAFLDSRQRYIDKLGGAYAGTAYRVRSYRHMLDSGNMNFDGGKIEALENGGGRMTVSCA